MKPAVFLDRDGTINRDVGYVNHPDQLELIPRSAEAIRMLNNAEHPVVVITNQAGIAKGIFREEDLPTVHEAFVQMLAGEGARIDGFYFCPHHPAGTVEKFTRTCACRKPAPGLLHQAGRDMNIELSQAWVVGDKASDVQLAHNVGATAVMVLTGHGSSQWREYPSACTAPHHVCNNLYEATQWILNSKQ